MKNTMKKMKVILAATALFVTATAGAATPYFGKGSFVEKQSAKKDLNGKVLNETSLTMSVEGFDSVADVYKAKIRLTIDGESVDYFMDIARTTAEAGLDLSDCESKGGQIEKLTISGQDLDSCHTTSTESNGRRVDVWMAGLFGSLAKIIVFDPDDETIANETVVNFKNL